MQVNGRYMSSGHKPLYLSWTLSRPLSRPLSRACRGSCRGPCREPCRGPCRALSALPACRVVQKGIRGVSAGYPPNLSRSFGVSAKPVGVSAGGLSRAVWGVSADGRAIYLDILLLLLGGIRRVYARYTPGIRGVYAGVSQKKPPRGYTRRYTHVYDRSSYVVTLELQ